MLTIERQPSVDLVPGADILAMYAEILPLLYHNPRDVDIADQLNICLSRFVKYDFIHYLMDATLESKSQRFGVVYETWGGSKSKSDGGTPADGRDTTVSMGSSEVELEDHGFEQALSKNYQNAIDRYRHKHPSATRFHYHRISSDETPRIAIGIFRRDHDLSPNPSVEVPKGNAFTARDLAILEHLSPHILLLYRTALSHIADSQAFQYFRSFSEIGTGIADRYKLSDMEAKLLPDILFGYSNEEIGKRHFISIPTVKTHINHILKKTNTRNRVDFISRFFTSPDHVPFRSPSEGNS